MEEEAAKLCRDRWTQPERDQWFESVFLQKRVTCELGDRRREQLARLPAPGCGSGKAWRLETKAWTYECASCGRPTSVTTGTIMHHSKLPLTAWFWTTYLMATHFCERQF